MDAPAANACFDYGSEPAVLIVGDHAARIDAASAAAEAAGARVAAALSCRDALARLQDGPATGAVMLELGSALGAVEEMLLDRVELLAREGLPVVIAFGASILDEIAAHVGETSVELLCDPGGAERVAALAFVLARRRSRVAEQGADERAERLRRLSDEVGRIARALAEIAEDEPAKAALGAHEPGRAYRGEEAPEVDLEEVRRVIRLRRLREQYFEPSLFGDPAWDILLDLFAARLARQRVAVSSLCIAAAVPTTTALRWIRSMTEQGLLARTADPHDARRVFMALSDGAAGAMARYFAAARKLNGAP